MAKELDFISGGGYDVALIQINNRNSVTLTKTGSAFCLCPRLLREKFI